MPMSNICERLFSIVRHVLTDRRNNANPTNLESQIFLNANRNLWVNREVNELTVGAQYGYADTFYILRLSFFLQ